MARRSEDKERVWRERVADQQGRGESIREFCRKRGLREASFYHWRREIRLRDRETAGKDGTPVLAPVVVVNEATGQPTPRSAATGLLATTRSLAATSIEIVLNDGTTIVSVPQTASWRV